MRIIKTIILLFLFTSFIFPQDLPEPMIPKRLVNDYTGLLSEEQQITLNNKLLAFNNETSTQIFVVTWDNLQGFDITDFGVRLANNWQIGQEGKDNGLLILVSPVNHEVTIQTGYGVEGVVTDAISRRIIETAIKPYFRTENYYAGLDSATNVMISLTKGEFTADDYMSNTGDSAPAAVIILMIFFILFFGVLRGRRRKFYTSGRSSLPWWILAAGVSRGSNWGSFSSGRGSFGGGGGFGGFSGGGGGSFGGGGASGGW